MIEFIYGAVVGLMVGGTLGVLAMALAIVAGRSDRDDHDA